MGHPFVYLNDQLDKLDWKASLDELSEQRRQQVLQFKHEQGRRECVAAYLLLRQALKDEYGIMEPPVFDYGEHGKPFIVDHPDIHFNMSHCREAAICVVSDRPVGVDIETVRNYHQSLVDYTMNADEVAQIVAAEQPSVAFIRLWTMKEAVLKLSGVGISNEIKDVLSMPHKKYTTVVHPQQRYIYTVCQDEV